MEEQNVNVDSVQQNVNQNQSTKKKKSKVGFFRSLKFKVMMMLAIQQRLLSR